MIVSSDVSNRRRPSPKVLSQSTPGDVRSVLDAGHPRRRGRVPGRMAGEVPELAARRIEAIHSMAKGSDPQHLVRILVQRGHGVVR